MVLRRFIIAAILPVSAVAFADDLPVVNSQKYCNAMFPLSVVAEEPSDVLRKGCLALESKFRARAVRIWSEIPEDVRDQCVTAQFLSPAGVSYEGIAHCLARHIAHVYLDGLE